MPAFTPLATSNEKKSAVDAFWEHDDEEPLEHEPERPRGLIAAIFNSRNAQHAKLFVLAVLALIHFYYLNDFLIKFAAMDRLADGARYSRPSIAEIAPINYTFQGFIDYKKNLWMTVGAMCASLATTASLLTIYSGPRDVFNLAAMAVIRVFDLCTFLFIAFLLFARISPAVVINHTTQISLRAAGKISTDLVATLGNSLSCTIEQRDELPVCSKAIIESIFPVKVIEYLIILCILTGAYIGLAYLIEWCIRHFFPPTHAKHTPISAISRNLIVGSHGSDNSVLIAA